MIRLPHTAAAIALGTAGTALAQTGDPATGMTLFKTVVQTSPVASSCEGCHGTAAVLYAIYSGNGLTEAQVYTLINNAINSNRGGMGAYNSVWGQQQRLDVAAYIMRGPHATPSPPPPPPPPPPPSVPPAPVATPNPVVFNATQIGQTSTTVTIQFTNSSSSTITFSSSMMTMSGGNTGDFMLAAPASGTQCQANGALGPGMSCSLGARFAPTAAGGRSATWSINFNGGVVARTVTLQGSGTTTPSPAPAPAPAPANSSESEGGGALSHATLAGLLAACLAGYLRRRRPVQNTNHQRPVRR